VASIGSEMVPSVTAWKEDLTVASQSSIYVFPENSICKGGTGRDAGSNQSELKRH